MQEYENDLAVKLKAIALDYDVDIEIYDEQIFAKQALKPNTIYCVLKYLSTNITYNVKTRPIQIIIVAEANNLEKAKNIFDIFTSTYNWTVITTTDHTYIKQQYSAPTVISNFNEVGYEFVSALYLSGTLVIIENSPDLSNFVITIGQTVYNLKPVDFAISYQANMDTQQMAGTNIALSKKTVSTVSIMFSVLTTDIPDFYSIIKGTQQGNTAFHVTFSLGDTDFTYDMILSSFQQSFEPGEAPSIRIGMIQ